ncbi:MAG: hypothetical protein NVS9B4_17840 [Candidatus Acidiferrum sp.]
MTYQQKPAAPQPLSVSIGKGTFFGVLANIVQVATRFITVPVVIAHLGLGGYGIWNIIMAITAYMRFGSAGIKSAYQKYVAEATGNGDYATANRLLSTGAALMLLLSVLGLIPVAMYSRHLAKAAGVPNAFLPSAAGAIAMLAVFMTFANWGAVYEAIVMGGHRIDLIRKLGTITTVGEAVAIIIVLHLGYGLFAMAGVMAFSEMCFIGSCMFISRKVVPQVRVNISSVTRKVLYELFRFGGSYQLVNVLEVLYVAIVPVAVLRAFGDDAAGTYALVTRVVTAAVMLQDAFILPVLSGGTMVFATGSAENMRSLVTKAFKATLALALPPLAFASVFGSLMIKAWTGQTNSSFPITFILVSFSSLCSAYSIVALVLYRASGKAIMDNVRQVLRIVTLLAVTVFASRLGFVGTLSGLALSNLVGVVFMLYVMEKTFHAFEVKMILPDALRISLATLVIVAVGALASRLPLPGLYGTNDRVTAVFRLGVVTLGCLVAALPAFLLTGSITPQEGKTLLQVIWPQRSRVAIPAEGKTGDQ